MRSPDCAVLFLFSLSSSGLFTFLPERGISEQTVQNKSLKVDKVRPPTKISAQSERVRALRKLFKTKVLKCTKLGHQIFFQPNRSVHARARKRARAARF